MTLPTAVATDQPAGLEGTTGRRVAIVLLVASLAGVAGTGFLGLAPNRILTPRSLYLWRVEPPVVALGVAAGIALVALSMILKDRGRHWAGLAGWTLALATATLGAGTAATHEVVAIGGTAARVSLGAAFWVIVAAAALGIADGLQRLRVQTIWRVGLALAALLLLILAAATGWFDDLSLAREWASRRDVYAQAFGQHMALVGVSLALSIVIGVPLGIVAARDRRASARILDALNIFQTIPSIALFGLLIGPLTALSTAAPLLRAVGVNGIGFTPAVIALVLYALLPVARNTDAAVRSIPTPLIESARAMGMAPLQILFHVTLPLALPILLAGLRIVVVQLIGLAVVAALIGAGGFGSFVFVGLGQTATDLVLLGALSAIAVAMIADALLRLLSAAALARVQS
jgi:osmoprotectant transport system permease protein